MERDLSQFVSAVKRIPLFEGLSADQVMGALLRACERRTCASGDTICTYGEPSTELFILLSGRLSVRSRQGFQIARIEAVSPVGEMGIFTDEPRSATVVCAEGCTFLVLAKPHLGHLLRRHPDIELVVSRRLIAILSQRIRDANLELTHLRDMISDQEAGARSQEEADAEPGSDDA